MITTEFYSEVRVAAGYQCRSLKHEKFKISDKKKMIANYQENINMIKVEE
jgi:hypothetical protein